MSTRDWADELAAEIIGDVIHHRSPATLIAARLRLVKAEGVGEGIEQAQKIIRGQKVPA